VFHFRYVLQPTVKCLQCAGYHHIFLSLADVLMEEDSAEATMLIESLYEIDDFLRAQFTVLFVQCFRSGYELELDSQTYRAILEYAERGAVEEILESDSPGSRIFLARVDGEIAGTIGFAELSNTADCWGLYVAPNLKGQGIGSQLILHVCNSLQTAEILRLGVLASSRKSIAFYLDLGFRPICSADSEFCPGTVLRMITMEASVRTVRAELKLRMLTKLLRNSDHGA